MLIEREVLTHLMIEEEAESGAIYFASPAFRAKRKGHLLGRLVIDFRLLNRAIKKYYVPSSLGCHSFLCDKKIRYYSENDL